MIFLQDLSTDNTIVVGS